MLKAENILYKIGSANILQNISATFLPNEFNVILGPNGSGKSSFLKICSAEINNFSGDVFYDTINIKNASKESLAKYRAVMSQQPELSFPLTVAEVVMMGRYPHFNFNPTKNDENICEAVITKMNLTAFTERNYLTLSGGEKQRVQYARVLAQIWEAPTASNRFLFLDEPLNNLDIKYQQEFLQIAKTFTQKNTVLIAVLHDINIAIQFADKVFFLKEGKLVAQGKPTEIVTVSLLKNIFDVDCSIIENPSTGKPLVIYT
jgi:iron complex transport system ATP-binding protein